MHIVDINRFEKITYAEKPSFYNKLFTSSEIEYCLRFKTPAEHFAGKFAIKESLKKSIEEGEIGDVEILILTSRDPGLPPVQYLKNSGGLFI